MSNNEDEVEEEEEERNDYILKEFPDCLVLTSNKPQKPT